MKPLLWLFSFGLVVLFLIIMSVWGDQIMLLNPMRFMKSEWDKGAPIEKFALHGVITSIDEGRGLKIGVDNLDTLLRINGLLPVNSNAKLVQLSPFAFGDSLVKLVDNDTFTIIHHDSSYVWRVERSSLQQN